MKKERKKTIIVNAFAGPGAGKTTAAWDIAAALKKRGIETEYVSEYAKELVWDGNDKLLDGSCESQEIIYAEQKRRVDRLIGKVDVVVTDSPILLSMIYVKKENRNGEDYKKFKEKIIKDFKNYESFNFFINRDKEYYQNSGRIHTQEEALAIDTEIKKMLEESGIYFGRYYHSHLGLIADNVEAHLKKINK